jgi:hypothetical protein
VETQSKKRLWIRFLTLFFVPVLISLAFVHMSLSVSFGEWLVNIFPQGGIRATLERVDAGVGGAAVSAVASVWALSPFTIAAGFLLIRRIVGEHIISITPHARGVVLFRLTFGVAAILVTAISVVMLPGRDAVYCSGCEQSLTPLLLLNHAQMYALGGLAGYLACLFSILSMDDRRG